MVGYKMSGWLDIKCLDDWIENVWMVGYKMSGWLISNVWMVGYKMSGWLDIKCLDA